MEKCRGCYLMAVEIEATEYSDIPFRRVRKELVHQRFV